MEEVPKSPAQPLRLRAQTEPSQLRGRPRVILEEIGEPRVAKYGVRVLRRRFAPEGTRVDPQSPMPSPAWCYGLLLLVPVALQGCGDCSFGEPRLCYLDGMKEAKAHSQTMSL
eukprot:s630_g4.t2